MTEEEILEKLTEIANARIGLYRAQELLVEELALIYMGRPLDDLLRALTSHGSHITAIKLYRNKKNCTLVDAKTYIDALVRHTHN